MTIRVIVLNGGSSSGKSSLLRALQWELPQPWLAAAVDTFVDSLPPSLLDTEAGIDFGADGEVSVGADFRRLEAAWSAGVAATVRAGAPVIVDDVFLRGKVSQDGWRRALSGLEVLWVGVRCDAAVAAEREAARGDRVAGMAASQAEVVHEGVEYDVEVDTASATPQECARAIVARISSGAGRAVA